MKIIRMIFKYNVMIGFQYIGGFDKNVMFNVAITADRGTFLLFAPCLADIDSIWPISGLATKKNKK